MHSAFAHRGTARLLVHRLKYGGHRAAAAVLAEGMAGCVPEGAGALVPVPRARLRHWRYGVDPAVELARALGRLLRLPVVPALAPEWWHRRRAGPPAPGAAFLASGWSGRSRPGRSWWTTW